MSKYEHASETPATALLKKHGAGFSEHLYAYEEHGGTAVSAREPGVPVHGAVKTPVLEGEAKRAFIVLMHGDRKVSTENLAWQIGMKKVEPCTPEAADRHSVYLVGGTSPFGTRKKLPVYVEKSVLRLEKIYINGGRRRYLLGIDPGDLARVLDIKKVEVALDA